MVYHHKIYLFNKEYIHISLKFPTIECENIFSKFLSSRFAKINSTKISNFSDAQSHKFLAMKKSFFKVYLYILYINGSTVALIYFSGF